MSFVGLGEAMVLQQSIAYGNYAAELIEFALYDERTRALVTDPANREQQLALLALQANPVLARNVIMLAMRHAIRDVIGGPDQAEASLYRQTYYGLALMDFKVSASSKHGSNSDESLSAKQKLAELFPKWNFVVCGRQERKK